ncbi:MAG: hypothetical protein QM723_12965 [Myxococcaceae bacterium]
MFHTKISMLASRSLDDIDPMARARSLLFLRELAHCAERVVLGSQEWDALFGSRRENINIDIGRATAQFSVDERKGVVTLVDVWAGVDDAVPFPLWRAYSVEAEP